jgi:hypothetical protein
LILAAAAAAAAAAAVCRQPQDEMFEVPEDFNLFDDPWDMLAPGAQDLAADPESDTGAAAPSAAAAAGADSHRVTSSNGLREVSHQQQEGLDFIMEDLEQEVVQQEDMEEGEGMATPQPPAAAKAKAGGRGGGRCKRKANQIIVDELKDLQIK